MVPNALVSGTLSNSEQNIPFFGIATRDNLGIYMCHRGNCSTFIKTLFLPVHLLDLAGSPSRDQRIVILKLLVFFPDSFPLYRFR